jgi:Ser/Thr protein kinase RdoA (MazF antagonist)
VNAPAFHTRAEIDSELEWLRAIIRDTKLTVPEPVRASNGDWITSVDLPQLGIWRYCVLFTYLDAKSIKDEIKPQQMEFLGALIALLHKHGETYQVSKGFIRKHWDLEGLKGEMLDVPPAQAYAALTEQERDVVRDAEKIVKEGMDALGRSPKVYGLIHGDLHLKSMLFSGGRPVVIDFDTCGYGYYIYDLSVAIWDIFHREDFPEMRKALLGGYRKVRPLSEQEESLLMHFVAGRLMAQILTWAPRREHSTLTEIADKAIEKQVNQLERLVEYLER